MQWFRLVVYLGVVLGFGNAPAFIMVIKKNKHRELAVLTGKARRIYRQLKRCHPDAHIELAFKNPLQLMVATILSAQCTDVTVNKVTPVLFNQFSSAKDYATASLSAIEKIIRPTGFFRQKAKSIKRCAELLLERHGGKVPATMDELTKLPGIGRKTANVVLGNAFGIPGLPVDTHVTRISNRLGLSSEHDAVKIERDLCLLIPKKEWTQFSHTLIFHGRRVCKARKPLCNQCPVSTNCDFYNEYH